MLDSQVKTSHYAAGSDTQKTHASLSQVYWSRDSYTLTFGKIMQRGGRCGGIYTL